MSPRFRAVAVEQRGGRTVFVLERQRTGERTRIYRRGRRWLQYSNDLPVPDQGMVRAVNRLMHVLRGERETQLALYPSSQREVKATSQAPGEATTTATSASVPAPDVAVGARS